MTDEPRVNRQGMVGPYGARYSWAYWVAVVVAGVLLIVHFALDGAEWTTVAALVLIVLAVLLRPGGIRGPRARERQRAGTPPT